MYSRGASVAVVVFDLTSRESFEDLDDWLNQVRTDSTPNCEIVVAANKCDLCPVVELEEVHNWSNLKGFIREVVCVSAKTGQNIDSLFQAVCAVLPEAAFRLKSSTLTIDDDSPKAPPCC
jgi:Ras-related protein Rab-2A